VNLVFIAETSIVCYLLRFQQIYNGNSITVSIISWEF